MDNRTITPFLFGQQKIRVILIDDDPWFIATDVCTALGIDPTAIRKLDDDEKGLHSMQTLGGVQEVSIINESGLYTMILRCRDATKHGTVPHQFRKWVTNEVLPSIRKTGSYHIGQNNPALSPLPYSPAFEIQIAESAARTLRMSDTSKIRMFTSLCEIKGINPSFLPAYVDEPLVKAITTLLKEIDHPFGHHVAKLVNPTLEKMGILEHLSRKGRSNEIKKFWNLTAEGLQYGRNETSPNNPRETQPLFFVERFPDLLQRLETYIDEHALLTINPQ
ncbi:hypothetical protein CKO12_11845 [Chromatium okenii]|uniref:BRO-N domain-containing protein n=1 Tax=Chromatium okenii TaxID=61644 RepID=UPI001908B2C5|nr:BRO family protein [Chromatium okenii]MBK1642556.1 hypothetical protein [Chromatium okenii]